MKDKEGSNTDLRKKAPPNDEFGKDFFKSWKSAKLGKESMDFDMETVPKNKMTSFKFDELDNFELSGNFDKLSSFKLNDLDFPGLSKENEKTHEKCSKDVTTGKRESKEDKFSFDFDFNGFDLDSKSPEVKRPHDLFDIKVLEHSSKHGIDQESSDNISTSNNILKETSVGKRASIDESNEKKMTDTISRKEHSYEKYLLTDYSDKGQDFCLQSSSDNGSAELALVGIQTSIAPLDAAKPEIHKERPEHIQPFNSSPSESSSPVDSYQSEYLTKLSGKEISNPGNEFNKRQTHGPLNRINGSLTDSIKFRKEFCYFTAPKKSNEGVKNIDAKQSPCQNPLPPCKPNSDQNLMRPPLKSLQTKTVSPSHQTSLSVKNTEGSSLMKLCIDPTVDPKLSSATYNTISGKGIFKPKLDCNRNLGSQNINSIKDASSGDNSNCGIRNSAISKTIEMNSNKECYLKPTQTKSVHFLESRMACPLIAINLDKVEKHVYLHAPLKRKIDQELGTDLETSSQLKCVKGPTADQRTSFEAPQNIKRKTEPEIKVTETCKDFTPAANLTLSTASTEIGKLVTELSSKAEDEYNLLNSEAFMKDLDTVSSNLRKEKEGLKELEIRLIINSNQLLLLDFSLLEENIQALQKLTNSLAMET